VQKLLDQFSQNSVERCAHGARKKPLYFGGNLDLGVEDKSYTVSL